jgi:hypothetical protein
VLSAALSLALFVAGHFSADLRNFDAVVDSPAITAIARALYYLLPNFATFDAKAADRPRACRSRSLHVVDGHRLRRSSTSPRCSSPA